MSSLQRQNYYSIGMVVKRERKLLFIGMIRISLCAEIECFISCQLGSLYNWEMVVKYLPRNQEIRSFNPTTVTRL